MIYCLNPQCPKPPNPDSGKFCVSCGQKLLLGDRYVGVKLIQQAEKGRTILGINRGTTPESYCIIKQAILTGSVMNQAFIEAFEQNIVQLKELGDRREFPKVLDYFIPSNFQNLSVPPTVIFEKIEGESLRQKLNYQGQFSEAAVKDFLIEVLPLVQAIHDQGIVHRDLNPENFIFTPKKYWAIVDFTAAKVTSKVANVQQGTLIGSGIYTAPEQLRGKTYPASDLYSLGVICLELLTGIHPFDLYSSQCDEWVWRDYLTTPVNAKFADLLNQMIAERVGDRPPSATAILETLGIKNHAVKQSIYSSSPVTLQSEIVPQFTPKVTPKKVEPQWHCFRTLTGHGGYISDLVFNDRGQILASASVDQTIRIWDLKTRQEKFCLRGHQNLITHIFFRGDRLISGSWDYTVRIWDWRKGEELERLMGRSTWVQDFVFFENSLELIVLGADDTLTLWNMEELSLEKSWSAQGATQLAIHFGTDELITVNNRYIYLWEYWGEPKIATVLREHLAPISLLKISPNGRFFISIDDENNLKFWNLTKLTCDRQFFLPQTIQALAIFPNGRFFCLGDKTGILSLWQVGQDQLTTQLDTQQGEIKAIAISPDSQIIATGGQDKTIKLWRFGIQ